MSSSLAQETETWDFGTEDPSLPVLLLKRSVLHTDESGEAIHTESQLFHGGIAVPTAWGDQISFLISFN